MRAYLTIAAMCNYNPNLFEGLNVPQGMDKDNVVDNIILECSDLEILYPNPDTLQSLITIWAKKMLPVWEKLYSTLSLDYDPIYNYDRTFEITETTRKTGTDTHASETQGTTENSGTDTTQRDRVAYNSQELVNDTKDTFTAGTKAETSGTVDATDSMDHTEQFSRDERSFGNIGVTTTQQMIEQEREVDKFNMVDVIVSQFREKFCILIY